MALGPSAKFIGKAFGNKVAQSKTGASKKVTEEKPKKKLSLFGGITGALKGATKKVKEDTAKMPKNRSY